VDIVRSRVFSDSYPVLLVGNKVDLVRQRVITTEQGQQLAAELNVSARDTHALCTRHRFLTLRHPPANTSTSTRRSTSSCASVAHSTTTRAAVTQWRRSTVPVAVAAATVHANSSNVAQSVDDLDMSSHLHTCAAKTNVVAYTGVRELMY
jgi:hypothetical protein